MLIFRTFSEYRHSFLVPRKGEKYGMNKTDEMCSLQGNNPGVDVIQVKLEDLHAFKNHPFKVEKNQELFELRQSIESEGILVPLLVRKSCDESGYDFPLLLFVQIKSQVCIANIVLHGLSPPFQVHLQQ